jgi:hypothetical protein
LANILLTERCVRECPYCFAKKQMSDLSRKDLISWEDLIHIADLFEGSQEHHLSLLGGEPTLHPHFVDFVLYLHARNFHITVFTSGIMSDERLDEARTALKEKDLPNLNFVCNLNDPESSSPGETGRVHEFLKVFGPQTTLSFNIYRTDFGMDFLFEHIERFRLKRHVRLGLAHPIAGEHNQYIPPERFGEMVDQLFSFLPQFERFNVSPGFDCGFPLCVFTDEQLGRLNRIQKGEGASIRFVCNPALDIGADMSVWSCFPLARYKRRSLYEFNSVNEVREHYKAMHVQVRNGKGGVYPSCDTCVHRSNEHCAGGCLAHIVNRAEGGEGRTGNAETR